MPALPPVPSVVRTDLVGTIGTTTPWNTRYFLRYSGGAPTVTDLTNLCTATGTAYTNFIAPLVDTSTHLTLIKAVDLTANTAAEAQVTEAILGTRVGTSPPASTAMVISYEVAVRYRGGHPRSYWRMGVGADQGVADWTPSFVTSAQNDIVSFFNAVTAAAWPSAGGLSHVAVSYYYTPQPPDPNNPGSHPRPQPIVYPVTALVARTSLGTQRRRVHYNG